MGASGYVVVGAVLFLAFLWLGTYRKHIISRRASITLEVLTLVLMIWLLPYFTTARLKRQPENKFQESTD